MNDTNLTAEELLLSACIDAKRDTLSDIMAAVTEDDFFFPGTKQLFRLFKSMYLSGEEITAESVVKLHAKDLELCHLRLSSVELVTAYGRWCIAFEQSYEQTGKPLKNYIPVIIKKLKTLRKGRYLQKIATDIQDGLQAGKPPDDIFKMIEDRLIANDDASERRSYLTPKDMGLLMLEATAERMDKERHENEVIYTSFKKVNQLTGGFEKGDLIILSAQSGVGKSAFSINMARDVAIIAKKPVLYLNSEMSDKQQARRYASMLSQVSHQAIRDGLTPITGVDGDSSFKAVSRAADMFAKGQLYTITIPDLQIGNVVAEVRRMKERYAIQMVIVDYVGRMDTITNKDAQEWQLMEAAARTLKTMAQELDMVVIMVAQLSSNGVSLAKGASMKNECDLWMNLSRIDKEARAKANQFGDGLADYWNTYLEFRKARNVETGATVLLHFHGDTLTFTDDEKLAQEFYQDECDLAAAQ